MHRERAEKQVEACVHSSQQQAVQSIIIHGVVKQASSSDEL